MLLAAAAAPLAAPGADLVPGAGADAPRWVLGPYGEGLGLGAGAYLGALYVAFAAYVAVVAFSEALGRRWIWGAIVALVLAFALAPPLLSLDVFSYISYARLGVEHGLDPYESVPAAIPADPAASRVDDWRFAVSVYGPLFTFATYPLGALGVSVALWSLKGLSAVCVVGTAALTARLAAARGASPPAAAALVALNPLVLVHVVGGAHNDGLMVVVMTAGIAAVLSGLQGSGGACLIAAAAVKVPGLLTAPFAFLGSARRGRFVAGAVAAAAAIGAATLAAFGPDAADALGIAGDNQALTSRYSVPATAARIAGVDVDPVRFGFLAAYVVLLVGLLAWVARGGDWLRAAGWAVLGLLVATAWMVPWYVIWVLPLAALARDRALVAAALALTAFQAVNAVPI